MARFAYDHRSQAISIPYSADDFTRRLNTGKPMGLNLWASTADNHSDRITYRHEHAHFASFNFTGLSDLAGLIIDHRLLLYAAGLKALGDSPSFTAPLLRESDDVPETDAQRTLLAALAQIGRVEALFIGYGTTDPVDTLFDWAPQQAALDALSLNRADYLFSAKRMEMFFRQMRLATDADVARLPDALVPRLPVSGQSIRISSRAVMEAYSITIETVSEHISFISSSLDTPRSDQKRRPSLLDYAAIGLALEMLYAERQISIDAYVDGQAGSEVYWALSVISFVSLQVPVLAETHGYPTIFGSLKQLCPAQRFLSILHAIQSGAVADPAVSLPLDETDEAEQNARLIAWIDQCHRAIGDPWSLKIAKRMAEQWKSKSEDQIREALFLSHDALSGFGRAVFLSCPQHVVKEAGILTPVSPRYVLGADGGIVASHSRSGEEASLMYIFDNAVSLLEALLLESRAEICWGRTAFDTQEQREFAARVVLHRYVYPHLDPSTVRVTFA